MNNNHIQDSCHSCTCALSKGPAEIPNNIQISRKSLNNNNFDLVQLDQNSKIEVVKEMLIYDLIKHFPQTLPKFQEIEIKMTENSLSGNLSIEMFLFGSGIDLNTFCNELTNIINQDVR